MRRRVIMGLLALGVVGGYGSGFAHLACARRWREHHQQQVMAQWARACTEAARAGDPARTAGAAPTIVVVPTASPPFGGH